LRYRESLKTPLGRNPFKTMSFRESRGAIGRPEGEVVYERITWAKCPACGAPAAVGWVTTAWADDKPVEQVPARLDCSAGCPVSLEELRRMWDEFEKSAP